MSEIDRFWIGVIAGLLFLLLLRGCDVHAAKWPDTKWPPDKDPVYQRNAPTNPSKWLDRSLTPPPESKSHKEGKDEKTK